MTSDDRGRDDKMGLQLRRRHGRGPRGRCSDLLGGKGASLAEMSNLGLPVPPGFTITTEVCTYFYDNGETIPPDLNAAGRRGARRHRAASSAPGSATPTPAAGLGALGRAGLDAGHDGHRAQPRPQRRTVAGPGRASGDPRFAYDTYRRFIQMYGDVVLGVEHDHFEEALEDLQAGSAASASTPSSTADDWQRAGRRVQGDRRSRRTGKPFPQDPQEQLWGAIGAVFGSWKTPRAITYRRMHDIPTTGAPRSTCRRWCSATWATTAPPASPSPAIRRPASSASTASSWSTPRARTWSPASARRSHLTARHGKQASGADRAVDGGVMPAAYAELVDVSATSSRAHYRDMQDIEFTIQQRQALDAADPHRQAHRQAALQIAVDMVNEGLIDAATRRSCGSSPASLDQLLHPTLDPKAERKVIATGLPASPGRRRRQGRVQRRRGRAHGGRRARR